MERFSGPDGRLDGNPNDHFKGVKFDPNGDDRLDGRIYPNTNHDLGLIRGRGLFNG
jgi:hypothetical protein